MNRPLLAAALLVPSGAAAHPGHHDDVPWTHLLVHADHLATIAMIAAIGGVAWLIARGRS